MSPARWWQWMGHHRADGGRRFTSLALLSCRPGRAPDLDLGLIDAQRGFLRAAHRSPAVPAPAGPSAAVPGLSIGGDRLEAPALGLSLRLGPALAELPDAAPGGHRYRAGGYVRSLRRQVLPSAGRLMLEGVPLRVAGTGWLAVQEGELDAVAARGWQWLLITLGRGVQLLLSDPLIDPAERYALLVEGGRLRRLGAGQLNIEAGEFWQSPHSGAIYPTRWVVSAGGWHLQVRADRPDQELRPPGRPAFWCGAGEVTDRRGTRRGRALVSLRGFARAAAALEALLQGAPSPPDEPPLERPCPPPCGPAECQE